MRPEEITALLRKRPFVPLRIHMTDGHTYEIHHAEVMIVSRSHAMMGLRPDAASGVFEGVEYLGLVHIVRIEELPRVAATGSPADTPA
jgi:hypothetical protein